jgi:hypothetical protein
MLTPHNEDQILALLEAAVELGDGFQPTLAEHGTQSVLAVLGQMLDRTPYQVSCTIRLIADNPQLGLTVIVTRGPYPRLHVADSANPNVASPELQQASYAMWKENLLRTIRSAVKVFTAYHNLTERKSFHARLVKVERANHRGILMNAAAFVATLEGEEDLAERIEEALRAA